MKFTEALDDYLEAKKDYDEAKASCDGYDFTYVYSRVHQRIEESKNVLNDLFKLGEQS